MHVISSSENLKRMALDSVCSVRARSICGHQSFLSFDVRFNLAKSRLLSITNSYLLIKPARDGFRCIVLKIEHSFFSLSISSYALIARSHHTSTHHGCRSYCAKLIELPVGGDAV